MLQQEQTSNFISILRTIAPWISGGLAGAILTLLAKIWSERKRRKVLSISINKQKFSLPDFSPHEVLPREALTVSYKNKEYKHLSLLTVKLENIGNGGINGQNLVFIFPPGTSIIEEFLITEPISIQHRQEDIAVEQKSGKSVTFDRIEEGDDITISFLVDSKELDKFRCLPRGLDDIEYQIGQYETQTEIERTLYKVLIYLAAYILVGAVSIIGFALQAIILFIAMPSIIQLFASIRRLPPNQITQQIEIGTVSADTITFQNEGNRA